MSSLDRGGEKEALREWRQSQTSGLVSFSLVKLVLDQFWFSGVLNSYPSLKPTFTLTSHLGKNVGLGEG